MSESFFEKIGVSVPEILLPFEGADLNKWSVVACDQFTSQPEYWQQVEELIENSPSTMKITLPEIYLDDVDCEDRILKINESMKKYCEDGFLKSYGKGFVLVERLIAGKVRKGIMVSLDLERYDYKVGSASLIRATEGTVLDRIPPRQKVRRNAVIETPHIMVLIDDIENTVIGSIYDKKDKLKELYDVQLMQDGGTLKGWLVDEDSDIEAVVSSLDKLDEDLLRAADESKKDSSHLLFAVGDGNHSLASAKAHWLEVKATLGDNWQSHPARFALVELVNLHDNGLEFEPIHRVVFNVNSVDIISSFENFVKEAGGQIEIKHYLGYEKMRKQWNKISNICNHQMISIVTEKLCAIIIMDHSCHTMPVGTLQNFLDKYLENNSEAQIDYIHGDDTVRELSINNNVGFILPVMSKLDLFKTVINEGALPRKTFSMGEANEKRYYMECRKIVI